MYKTFRSSVFPVVPVTIFCAIFALLMKNATTTTNNVDERLDGPFLTVLMMLR